jgi:hypothetical protein
LSGLELSPSGSHIGFTPAEAAPDPSINISPERHCGARPPEELFEERAVLNTATLLSQNGAREQYESSLADHEAQEHTSCAQN